MTVGRAFEPTASTLASGTADDIVGLGARERATLPIPVGKQNCRSKQQPRQHDRFRRKRATPGIAAADADLRSLSSTGPAWRGVVADKAVAAAG